MTNISIHFIVENVLTAQVYGVTSLVMGQIKPINLVLFWFRFDHGGYSGGGGGGNSRWVEEACTDGDWSKPTPLNERLEQ